MKITALNVPDGYLGLKELRLADLGSVVLLAGPNGAGKSRLLKCVAEFGGACLSEEERVAASVERANLRNSITTHEAHIANAISAGAAPDAPELVSLRSPIVHWQRGIEEQSERLKRDHATERDSELKPVIVPYDVERTQLRDWKDMPQREVLQHARNMEATFSVRIVPDAGLAAVRALVNRFVYASHASAPDLAGIADEVERLKGLIREFIGAELDWDLDGDPLVFGRPIAEAGLSAGQLVLLQVALSLFFQRGRREDLVLLMDEPENHLHPSAVLTMIDEVRRSCPEAQLWIATHSVHILAHFNPGDIWFVKDGLAEHVGHRSVDVLHSLVGGEKGTEELLEFIALPVQHALLSFAGQCLVAPSAVDTRLGDPQTCQIQEVLSGLASQQQRPIRVLDFGMGKGRLLAELTASVQSGGRRFADVFDYFGVDLYATVESRALCEERLGVAYPSTSGAGSDGGDPADNPSRFFADMATLRDSLDAGSVDVVVMCNTLHEIRPEEWLQYFGPNGSISSLVRQTGYLLVVEDQLLPVGERAHEYGYLVLDAPELRLLTDASNEDRSIRLFDSPMPKYRGRLKGHLLPAATLLRVSSESRRRALVRLRERSLENAAQIAWGEFSAREGRRYAFWCHQHVNASLALHALYGPQ